MPPERLEKQRRSATSGASGRSPAQCAHRDASGEGARCVASATAGDGGGTEVRKAVAPCDCGDKGRTPGSAVTAAGVAKARPRVARSDASGRLPAECMCEQAPSPRAAKGPRPHPSWRLVDVMRFKAAAPSRHRSVAPWVGSLWPSADLRRARRARAR